MQGAKDFLLVISLIANAGLIATFVVPLIWKPKA